MLAFFFSSRRKIIVRLRRAVSGNCPPDSRIWFFKSVGTTSPKQKRPVETGRYVISVHYRYHFPATKHSKLGFKNQILRSQVSTCNTCAISCSDSILPAFRKIKTILLQVLNQIINILTLICIQERISRSITGEVIPCGF